MALKSVSFFTGAMGLDLGLERSGFDTVFACENDRAASATIHANRPKIPISPNIRSMVGVADKIVREKSGLESDIIDLVVGGAPCQSFSTAGKRRGLEDIRGIALLDYLHIIRELKPRYAVLENVRGILSAELDGVKGGVIRLVEKHLSDSGYVVKRHHVNAADFGVPQTRERIIVIGSPPDKPSPELIPTHCENGLFGQRWTTLRDALSGLPSDPKDFIPFVESRQKFFEMLSAGQNWRDLPPKERLEAMGGAYNSSGGRTGFFRRLSWNRPAPTLLCSPLSKATTLCHPEETRPLSIQEYKRIQQFPDDYVVCGSLCDQYRQIGNAVPVGLGEAIGRAIIKSIKS